MNFADRLKQFREDQLLNKRELANKLSMSESYYNLLESGKREPSKSVLYKIALLSNLPEEYWVYGVTKENDITNIREDYKCIKNAGEFLKDIGELNDEMIKGLFKKFESQCNEHEKLLIKGLRADLQHILKKY